MPSRVCSLYGLRLALLSGVKTVVRDDESSCLEKGPYHPLRYVLCLIARRASARHRRSLFLRSLLNVNFTIPYASALFRLAQLRNHGEVLKRSRVALDLPERSQFP
jgi:hypothetical protein